MELLLSLIFSQERVTCGDRERAVKLVEFEWMTLVKSTEVSWVGMWIHKTLPL